MACECGVVCERVCEVTVTSSTLHSHFLVRNSMLLPSHLHTHACTMSHLTHHLSHITSHTSPLTRHLSHVTSHTSPLTRHLSHITSHTSPLTHHLSHITSHMHTSTHTHAQSSSPLIPRPRSTLSKVATL